MIQILTKVTYGSFGANNFDDLMIVIAKKIATASTLLDKVIPNHRGFFDNLSKMLKKNNNAIHNQKRSSLEKDQCKWCGWTESAAFEML